MADITIILATRTPPSNPEQKYGAVAVIGPCSQGPFDTPELKRNNSDLATSGYGSGVNGVAYQLARAGGPVIFVRSRSTYPGALWSPGLVKEPSGRAVLYVYGRVKLAGADANGDIVWQAKALGVSIQVQSGGALAASVNGKAILLTIPTATPASDVATFWNGVNPGAVAAKELANISAEGTGASDAGTTLAATSFDDGTLAYTGVDAGYTVRQKQNGNNTALGSSYLVKALTIDLATDADGTATSTANAVIAQISTGAVGKFTVAAVGPGTGLAGVHGSLEAIPFGSSGAITAAGTPYDSANLVVEVLGAGTVGSTAPIIRWAVDNIRREDARVFGRGNGAIALIARRANLSVKIVQQTGVSKTLGYSFDGRTLQINLGTNGSSIPSTTAAALQAYIVATDRLRAAFLAYLPSGDGTSVMEEADLVRMTGPIQTWSAPILVPSTGVVAIKNGAVDTGMTLTMTGAFDVGDIWAAQLSAPVSSIDDMTSAAAALLASSTIRPAGIYYCSPVSRSQAATAKATIRGALDTRQVWGMLQAAAWAPEDETYSEWRDGIVADWLGFEEELLAVQAGEATYTNAYTGRLQIAGGAVIAAGTAALAPYHQDLGKKRPGPTSGPLPNVVGAWADEIDDTTLFDNRFISLRTDEDAPGSYYFRGSPTMADPNASGRNRLQFTRTDLVCAREAKLQLSLYRNQALDYQTAADSSDGSPVGALTRAAAAEVEGALAAVIQNELLRKKPDGEVSMSPLAPGQKLATVTRLNDYSTDHTIYAEVGAPKRPPAEKAVLTVYDRPAQV